MSRRNLLLLVALLIGSLVCHGRNNHNPKARYVAEGLETIDALALDRPADEELVAGAMRGMVDVLRRRGDDHSQYLQPQAAQRLREEISGDIGGVGVRISLLGDPPALTVVGPPEPGTPAFFAGVEPSDRITAIDGEPTEGLSMNEVLDQMRGDVGQPVTLSIARGEAEEPVELTLTRALIRLPSVRGDRRLSDGSWRYLLEQDARIALVRLSAFGDHTVEELRDLLPELEKQGMRSLVLDLRDNAGGALDAAVGVCELFLEEGARIVETRGRDHDVRERFVAGRRGPYTAPPLAVVINGASASASEIVAACLQDNGRAVIVGERSYGKGTVQQLLPLEAGKSLLKLTTASYWRPSGENIHRLRDTPEEEAWGVRPDQGFECLLDDEALQAYRLARAERDVIAIDKAADPVDEEPSEETGAASPDDLAPPAEDPAQGPSEPNPPPAPYIDAVLDRAVEALQSELDASASVKVDAAFAD